ncbi:F-box associated interaction domain [Arabidopsis thaliana x Arabidopsis arenosa]|uniref:F-box associated interaction domain n=1 Tax=Arabidopsis thaliana x Arabidopsis arenosa TaxID=1240361 RepID=A0A8T2DE58_9BRAS|nr:F-box associated interaction domain [Arabidopsis thaliana x Arabidopsis arenosa]
MRTLRRNVTENLLTISRRRTEKKTSPNKTEKSVQIPVDIIIEILLRLPAKSIATCRCVSNLWISVICRQDFTELFLTRSLHRPQLLFSCIKDGNLFFFSSPQLQSPYENSSAISLKNFSLCYKISRPVNGLICFKRKEMNETVTVICNPSTGHTLSLPKPMKTSIGPSRFFVYEPIQKQFKVLLSYKSDEHQVLTLGTGELSWRIIECSIPHILGMSEICINGVLYYPAINLSSGDYIIVCFDVRSEKFRFITVMEEFIKAAHDGTLINYNGKLASLVSERYCFVDGRSKSIELWVLQDAEKKEWSKHTYVLPAWWQHRIGTLNLRFVGVTRTNEIMLSPCYQTVPFDVYYFNIERKTMMSVAIQGMEAFQGHLGPDWFKRSGCGCGCGSLRKRVVAVSSVIKRFKRLVERLIMGAFAGVL